MKQTQLNPNSIYIGAQAVQRIITVFRDLFPDAIEIHNPDAPSPTGNPEDDDRYFSADYLLSNILYTLEQEGILRAKLEYNDGRGKPKAFVLNKQGISGYQGMVRGYKAVEILMDGAAIVATATKRKNAAKA